MGRISSEDKLVQQELERQQKKQQKKNGNKSKNSKSSGRSKQADFSGVPERLPNETPQEAKKRKKQNSEILKSTVFFAVLFFAMVGYYCYYLVVEGEKVVSNSHNVRIERYAEKVVRGKIYTKDGEVIAKTKTGKDGTEKRVYPYDELFAHVVGMNSHGKTGIEKLCDYYLLTSNTNDIVKIINEFQEKKDIGNDVVTTLNKDLQEVCYDTLGKKDGAVVVLDNNTGEILAMVSKPDYNPNEIDQIWDNIDEVEGGVLLNRATQGLYTPGSIFKIFTTLEYIRENKKYNDFSYKCTGKDTFANYVINCYDSKSHGREDLEEAFAYSCNGAFATIGEELDNEKYTKNMNELLFISKLPIELEYNVSKFSLTNESSTFDVTQTAIGQGTTLVTPIHMAMVVQSIANDGVALKPQIISEIVGNDGSTVKKYETEEYKRLMSSEEAKILKNFMAGVTEYGTGKILSGASYKSYGKTGTAQIDKKNNVNSWFVGFASKGKKDITVCVVIENVPDGNVKAVECAKKIFDSYF